MSDTASAHTQQTLPVFRSCEFVVTNGVAEGDGISFAEELVMDDIYKLASAATPHALTVTIVANSDKMIIAEGSKLGTPGNDVFLDCSVTMMADDSSTSEALVLVEVENGAIADIYLLPLTPISQSFQYQLVGVDRETALARFGEMACVSFAKGTNITMASGEQRPIEDLQVGDRVLTRDDGAQVVRWIGQTTMRATGDFAPVVIKAGTLHNLNDLVLSPEHRIFIYQRQDTLGVGRSEVLVKVRHLINGDTVYQIDGGYVDYFQVLFDEHQIIYAEGVASESLLIDPRTIQVVPKDVRSATPEHSWRHHHDYEISDKVLAGAKAAEMLKKASSS